MPLGPFPWPLYARPSGNPETRLLTRHHQLEALGPALDDIGQAEARGLASHQRAVEQLAVRRPARVMHGYAAALGRVGAAGRPGPQDLVGQARCGLLGIGGRGLHIGWRVLLRRRDDVDAARRRRRACPAAAPSARRRRAPPESTGARFSPATISCTPSPQPLMTRLTGNVLAALPRVRAVEHLAVGRPARVVDGHEVVGLRLRSARARLQHLGRQPRSSLGRIRGRLGDIGRRGNRLGLRRTRRLAAVRRTRRRVQGREQFMVLS